MKKILYILGLLSLPFAINAQYSWSRPYFEVGGIAGVSNYSGELVNSITDIKHMHLAGGLFVRYNLNKYLTFRLQGAYGTISGDDANASADDPRRYRNLHFRSHLFEAGVMGEINMMGFNPTGHDKMFSPYAFIGFTVFNYNPKARHFDPNIRNSTNEFSVALSEQNTEGQGVFPPNAPRSDYNLTQLSIPMGLGVKFAVHSHINIGFEIGFRKTFTDYLDDVGGTYAIDVLNGQSYYDNTPYSTDGSSFNLIGDNGASRPLSEQELNADRTYALLMDENGNVDEQAYSDAVALRGGPSTRGDQATDWYLITGLTISYNFIDNGLAGARKRRKRKAGCRSAQF